MKDIRFSNDMSDRNTDAVANLLVQPRLWIPGSDYPGYMDWREKAMADLQAETKRAMVAYWSSDPVGEILYQRHPADRSVLEIRNISIERHARGRHMADFLLKQIEMEAAHDFPGVHTIVADTKRTNQAILRFVLERGYTIEAIQNLPSPFSHNGTEDVVFSKRLIAA